MRKILNKLSAFIDRLSSKPLVGGLCITDSAIQYFLLRKDSPRPIKASLRLPPGVVEEGKIKDGKIFADYLKKLRESFFLKETKEILKVVVCLPSPIVYTQHFDTPNVGEGQLEETAELNLKINSPIDVEEAYAGWELISVTEDKYGLMGAFAEKKTIDAYKSALLEAGFYPVVFEFPSIALSWTINKVLGPKERIMLAVNVSSDGVEIFLLKRGFICFNYFIAWNLIKNEEEKITTNGFQEKLVEELNRVINFSENQFNESPTGIVFVAPGVEDLVQKTIEKNFEIKTFPLKESVRENSLSFAADLSIWYTVMGSAVRGGWDRGQDKFISLGTESAGKIFYQEQTLSFIRLWRNIFTGAASIFLVLLLGTYLIINFQPQASEEHEVLESMIAQQSTFKEFEEKAIKFNSFVATISGAGGETSNIISFINALSDISAEMNIVINRFQFSSFGSRIALTAIAPDTGTVSAFERALRRDTRFYNVEEPPFQDMINIDDGVSFKIGFFYSN